MRRSHRGGSYNTDFARGCRIARAKLMSITGNLAAIPKLAAIAICARVVPLLTADLQAKFDAGLNAFGDPRPLGTHGNKLDLVDSGATRGGLVFTSDGGTKVRAKVPSNYGPYLIGKYGVLPRGGQLPPPEWRAIVDVIADEEIDRVATQELA